MNISETLPVFLGVVAILVSGGLLSILYSAYKDHRTLAKTVTAIFLHFALHGGRINNIANIRGISLGYINMDNINRLIDYYFSINDNIIERTKIIIELYDDLYQVANHFNIPIERRIDHINGHTGPSDEYDIAKSFAEDKIGLYLKNTRKLGMLLPWTSSVCKELLFTVLRIKSRIAEKAVNTVMSTIDK